MKTNGTFINLPTEISDDYNHWANVTLTQSDRLKELELKRDILQLVLGQPDKNSNPPESDIIFCRSGSRASLLKAVDEAKERLIIVCPWLSLRSIDKELRLKFIALLAQGIRIDIGWGYSYDVGKIIQISEEGKYFIHAKGNECQNYSALPRLHELQASYPNLFHLKLMGTHAKYWVCDKQFAYVGSHNVLSSNIPRLNTTYLDLAGHEVGTLHKASRNIQKLIKCFENQPDLSTHS